MSDVSPPDIRRAEIKDVHDILRIDRESSPSPWSQAATIRQVTGVSRVHVVAELEHVVVGHGGLIFLGDQAHIATIAVATRHRRRGVGGALVSALFGVAQDHEYDEMTLEVRESNDAAIALYQRQGLEVVGRRKGYYGDTREDALIMTIAVKSSGGAR